MGLLCKRYDMIALLPQAAPKVHHNLPKAIITLNSPEAIIAGDLLCGRHAKKLFNWFGTIVIAYMHKIINKENKNGTL